MSTPAPPDPVLPALLASILDPACSPEERQARSEALDWRASWKRLPAESQRADDQVSPNRLPHTFFPVALLFEMTQDTDLLKASFPKKAAVEGYTVFPTRSNTLWSSAARRSAANCNQDMLLDPDPWLHGIGCALEKGYGDVALEWLAWDVPFKKKRLEEAALQPPFSPYALFEILLASPLTPEAKRVCLQAFMREGLLEAQSETYNRLTHKSVWKLQRCVTELCSAVRNLFSPMPLEGEGPVPVHEERLFRVLEGIEAIDPLVPQGMRLASPHAFLHEAWKHLIGDARLRHKLWESTMGKNATYILPEPVLLKIIDASGPRPGKEWISFDVNRHASILDFLLTTVLPRYARNFSDASLASEGKLAQQAMRRLAEGVFVLSSSDLDRTRSILKDVAKSPLDLLPSTLQEWWWWWVIQEECLRQNRSHAPSEKAPLTTFLEQRLAMLDTTTDELDQMLFLWVRKESGVTHTFPHALSALKALASRPEPALHDMLERLKDAITQKMTAIRDKSTFDLALTSQGEHRRYEALLLALDIDGPSPKPSPSRESRRRI